MTLNKQVNIRLSSTDRYQLQKNAKENGFNNMSDYLRFCGLKFPNMNEFDIELMVESDFRRLSMHRHKNKHNSGLKISVKQLYTILSDIYNSFDKYLDYVSVDYEWKNGKFIIYGITVSDDKDVNTIKRPYALCSDEEYVKRTTKLKGYFDAVMSKNNISKYFVGSTGVGGCVGEYGGKSTCYVVWRFSK